MLSKKQKLLIKKSISLFSVVRGYNIPILVLAQYLSAIFILAPEKAALSVVLDFQLFILILASSFTVASGYIINNFYDSKKDLINRPTKSYIDRLVSQQTKLQVYFGLNFLVALIAFFVSYRAVLFFSVYIFAIWFYSHKIKRYAILGNVMAALLAVLPIFAIFLYYKNLYEVIVFHALFLYLILLVRELVKDLENIKGDLANDYHTIAITYGAQTSKAAITCLLLLTIIPVYFLISVYDVGYMDAYFYFGFMVMLYFLQKLKTAQTKRDFLLLHNLLKFLIVAGVFCIVLIKPELLEKGIVWIGKII
jgi:4-hydroxybenzoate polyprenyltransferase